MRLVGAAVPGEINQVLTQVSYLLHETGLGLRRGGWMNWAAISTVTILLFLFGISLQTSWQVERLLTQAGSQVEISVYLQPQIQGEALLPTVMKLPDVANVEVITKEAAWKQLLVDLGAANIAGATEGLTANPLVDELKVKAETAAQVPQLAQRIAQIQGVDGVQYLNEALKNLNRLSQGFSQMSVMVVGILTLTAIAVITTTIRLIVMARHHEIEIMQLVGATATWIYLPFILQGLAFGLVGAAIAWAFLASCQQFVDHLFSHQSHLLQILGNSLHLSWSQTLLLPLILLGFGSLIGFVGSLLAVRQFAFR